jgi:hypothetical protein
MPLRRLSYMHGKCPVGEDLPGEVRRPDILRFSRPVSDLLAPPVLIERSGRSSYSHGVSFVSRPTAIQYLPYTVC